MRYWHSISSLIIQILLTIDLGSDKKEKKKVIPMELGLEPKTYDMLTKNSPVDLHARPRNGVCIIEMWGALRWGTVIFPGSTSI